MDNMKRWDGILILIMGLAAVLNVYNIWHEGLGNTYYAATVKSMLHSFHNFFFASYDPAGFITVDKPPAALWIQTISAKIFGYHGWALILPQVLAGVASVGVLYAIVKPTFGRTAALIASVVLAITPISVAVARTNNVDTILVFLLLLATWSLFKSVRNGKLGWLLLTAVFVGIGFNVKMLQAYMVVPAIYLFYVLASKVSWRKKWTQLGGATAVLLVVSVLWAVIVDSIPPDKRPYIGSSKTNSVLELAFGYNGISRLTGEGGPSGMIGGGMPIEGKSGQGTSHTEGESKSPPSDVQPAPGGMPMPGSGIPQLTDVQMKQLRDVMEKMGINANNPAEMMQLSPEKQRELQSELEKLGIQLPMMPGAAIGGSGPSVPMQPANDMGIQMPANDGMPTGGGMGMSTGKKGPFRLFQTELGGQISWLLGFALLAAFSLFADIRRRRQLNDEHREAIFWYAWLLPMMGFFSIASFFHSYYLSMLAPAIAALTGIGLTTMWKQYRETTWTQWIFPVAIILTSTIQAILIHQSMIQSGWAYAVGGAGITLAISMVVVKNAGEGLKRTIAIVSLTSLLIAPLYWSMTPALYGDNSILPEAGPQLKSFAGMNQILTQQGDPKLVQYLNAHNNGETYLVATASNMSATPIQLETDRAVMMYGGYLGSDPAVTVERIEQYVKNGDIRFFLVSRMGFGDNQDITNWIVENCEEVPASEWQSDVNWSSSIGLPMTMSGMNKLYVYNGK
ncbi:glycosyltransferase family 39 protein [Paenibacillus roseipurpureus]|uniref:Glycosyltransferase family 39 protein n=1 Tax=Paenibacillus roseopurpureus TaxID=2918901 RepID=A0AA96LP24_9BACL|nr:glycosyltransferase family 39 protein [Paenibacillus sp. MBLB1832]WNR44051.1 glycosyltransferase family 39 protein [Paenibacillus sp. MBLB1832]